MPEFVTAEFEAAALQFVEKAPQFSTPGEVLSALDEVAGYRKLMAFCAVMVPTNGDLFSSWKPGVTSFYNPAFKLHQKAHEGYVADTRRYGISPLISYIFERNDPFTVTEAMHALNLKGDQYWVFAGMRRYGIRDGLYCPHRNWVLQYISPVVLRPPSRSARALLTMAASAAVARIDELVKKSVDKDDKEILTSSERQVLYLLSQGKSTAQTAKIMQITVFTVRYHIRQAVKVLDANSALHAVAKAVKQGLLK